MNFYRYTALTPAHSTYCILSHLHTLIPVYSHTRIRSHTEYSHTCIAHTLTQAYSHSHTAYSTLTSAYTHTRILSYAICSQPPHILTSTYSPSRILSLLHTLIPAYSHTRILSLQHTLNAVVYTLTPAYSHTLILSPTVDTRDSLNDSSPVIRWIIIAGNDGLQVSPRVLLPPKPKPNAGIICTCV